MPTASDALPTGPGFLGAFGHRLHGAERRMAGPWQRQSRAGDEPAAASAGPPRFPAQVNCGEECMTQCTVNNRKLLSILLLS
mmetsp:Transcript_18545/g.41777  ORF Transcript_18545/g.41777 Transcript_18545/m.41777 type:complete len:82 (-) Transcript_18545:11-256(-)